MITHKELINAYCSGDKTKAEIAEMARQFIEHQKNLIHDAQHILYRVTGDGLRPEERNICK